jgi:hypothetical protein
MARDFADKSAARQWVWDRLVAEGVARFPFPPHGRIPNFAGAEVAAARLFDIVFVRHVLDQKFGQIVRLQPNVPVTVTGVAFFDTLHGQEGVAPNAIELHPIFVITFP